MAVLSTIPWDSYLIRNRIWTYPDYAVLGPVIFGIPLEELFFFFIQTYNTSLLYMCISKPTFHPIYLQHNNEKSEQRGLIKKHGRLFGILGQVLLAWVVYEGIRLVRRGGVGTYLGLIVIWAMPFLLLIW